MLCYVRRRRLCVVVVVGPGWWLGYFTISGLGTLTALQISYNFATDCTGTRRL